MRIHVIKINVLAVLFNLLMSKWCSSSHSPKKNAVTGYIITRDLCTFPTLVPHRSFQKMNPREKNSRGLARLRVLSLPEVTVRGRGPLGRPRQGYGGVAVPPPLSERSGSAGGEGPMPCPARPGRAAQRRDTGGSTLLSLVPLSGGGWEGRHPPGSARGKTDLLPGPPPPGRPQPRAGRRRGRRGEGRSTAPAGVEGHWGPPARDHHRARWRPLWFSPARFHDSCLPINLVSPPRRWLVINRIPRRAVSSWLATCITYSTSQFWHRREQLSSRNCCCFLLDFELWCDLHAKPHDFSGRVF